MATAQLTADRTWWKRGYRAALAFLATLTDAQIMDDAHVSELCTKPTHAQPSAQLRAYAQGWNQALGEERAKVVSSKYTGPEIRKILAQPCQTCGAQPTQRCVRLGDPRPTDPHAARARAAGLYGLGANPERKHLGMP